LIEKYNPRRHNIQAVKDLLAMAMGRPTPERIQTLLDKFYSIEKHPIFVALDNNDITGMIGIDHTALPHGWIIHLAVQPALRKRGIGRSLIDHAIEAFSIESVALETDQGAVGFYRACGFNAVEIVSKWPGIHRYRCTKGQMPESMLEYYDSLTLPEP
jgi:ribosomal protein S18 acetylase RimI-like enzyme